MNSVTNSGFDFGWLWFVWIGFFFLMFSSLGNWGYAYSAHRKFDGYPRRTAADILNERYATGEIDRAQYQLLKADIAADHAGLARTVSEPNRPAI